MALFTGCNGSEDLPSTSTTEPTITTTAATEDVNATIPETIAVSDSTHSTESTTAPVTENGTTASAVSGVTSGTAATTTKQNTAATKQSTAAPKKPTTTAEIVAYFNAAANKVKTAKPGYSHKARTIIDDKKVSSPNGFINTVAPPIINMAKGFWSDWSEPNVVAKGSNHNDFPVSGQSWSSKLDPSWVKSATCTTQGSSYKIRIVLKDERVATLPTDQTKTKHGQVIKAFTKGEIADGASEMGVDISTFDCTYSGNYIEYTVDIATGNVKSATYYTSATVHLIAKYGLTVDATLPLAQEHVYTF
ncbi:MAG: hypothetical protein LBQ33_04795 [Oscillospiraceae bacterium]|nr:hypothetical protein [Oscillospiraceae bacterium]